MTAYQLQILLYYYRKPSSDYPDMANDETAWSLAKEYLLKEGLIGVRSTISTCYEITNRGAVFIQYVLELDLPIQSWQMP